MGGIFRFFSLFLAFDFDVRQRWMNAHGQIARQRPRSRRPGNDAHIGRFVQWKTDNDSRIRHVLVVLIRFKIGERSGTSRRIRHHLDTDNQ